jgi:hypothetical protein
MHPIQNIDPKKFVTGFVNTNPASNILSGAVESKNF